MTADTDIEFGVNNSMVVTFLVICLIIASSNLGLINVSLSLKARDGGNLVGIRDVLLLLTLLVGTLTLLKQPHTALRNPISRLSLLLVVLSPVAALVGMLYGGQFLSVARESVTMFGWLLAFVLGSNLRSHQALRAVCNAMIVVGLLVTMGVFVEAFTFGEVRVVTPADDVSITGRSTPSGWPLMMISWSLILVLYLMDRKSAAWATRFRFVGWIAITVASLLTQSRTLLVGLVTSIVILVIFCLRFNRNKILWHRWIVVMALIPVVFVITFLIGQRVVRTDFTDYFAKRYAVLSSIDSLIEYSEEDTRRAEIELGLRAFRESPVLGLGLGTSYREDVFTTFERKDPAILVHNVFAFFLFRYGPLGILIFTLIIFRVLKSLSVALRDSADLSLFGIGLGVSLVNLFACAFFGNVFGTTYGVPQALICLGCLIAYEEIRDYGSVPDHPRSGVPNRLARGPRLTGPVGVRRKCDT